MVYPNIGKYYLLNLMLNILKLIRHFIVLPDYILYFAYLIEVKVQQLVALLQPERMILQLFGVILERVHDYPAHLRLKLEPLGCLRFH